IFRPGEEPIIRAVLPRPLKHCIFEDIYFARPDSLMESGRVLTRRQQFGVRLAKEWEDKGFSCDVVVAVPDTSRPAAHAMARALGVPCDEGFIKNRYSGRTFIMPDQASREAAMRLKLNPIREIFKGRRVVLVDDSIVRGTTMRRIVQMVRRLGPAELHVAIFSPPVRNPCFYGIDMPTKNELVAGPLSDVELSETLSKLFGCDSVTFLSNEGLVAVAGSDICAACFTGSYPVPINDEERGHIVSERRPE
ncbi:MAG: amidophosphoribosyltransferase, partial [Rhodobacterales bacterium]|nr:amidophosphoribosyltransferase [Rhodobacterales bacterium]